MAYKGEKKERKKMSKQIIMYIKSHLTKAETHQGVKCYRVWEAMGAGLGVPLGRQVGVKGCRTLHHTAQHCSAGLVADWGGKTRDKTPS